jgi:phosphoribosylformimino-5-aminoimidazole carboxamide ribonucleotide (ProFAR) isomerase
MLAIPALDLRRGVCVQPRCDGGEVDAAGGLDPLAIARGWATAGFRRIQAMDLDAEFGTGSNAPVLDALARDGGFDIQVAGGIQSADAIERALDSGACSVVLGARALDERDWLEHVVDLFPGALILSGEQRDRRVVTRGASRGLPIDLLDLIDELCDLPLAGLLLASDTEMSRSAWSLALIEDAAEAAEVPITVAGGVQTMNDLRALEHRGVAGVLLGASLYTGALDARTIGLEFGGG